MQISYHSNEVKQVEEKQMLNFLSPLSDQQKITLENQIKKIDFSRLALQKKLIQEPVVETSDLLEVFEDISYSGNEQNRLLGQKLIEEGRLGCLLLAGGQGTRLQFDGPKGIYPISIIKHKSLFQLCAEKVKAASQRAKRDLKLAIMTSPENDKETREYFEKNRFFGLNPSQLSFFVQGTLPLLDKNGQLFLKNQDEISMAADGNGESLIHLAKSGILGEWVKEGIQYFHVILIDNPLADPFDSELIGFHNSHGYEITLKCTEKLDANENVGIIAKKNDQCCVIEYSEMSDKEKNRKDGQGKLKFRCANLSLFCFSVSFIQRLLSSTHTLPLHMAWKAAHYLDDKGISRLSSQPQAWKFETFIFDWLLYSKNVGALIYPREDCFAPLKNQTGKDSPESVKKFLQAMDRKIIYALTGLTPPEFPFELAAEFYYPTSAMRIKWQGKTFSSSYLEP